MSAPADVSLFPPNSPEVGVELPTGFPAAAAPKRLDGFEEDVVAGFVLLKRVVPGFCPPNSEAPVWLFLPAWLF